MSALKDHQDAGYVLVLTLVSLVVLSLGMTIAAEQISKSQLRQIELRKMRDFHINTYSLENELGYALAKEYYLRVPDLGFGPDSSGRSSVKTRDEVLKPYLEALKSNYIWTDILLGVDIDKNGLRVEVHNRRSLIDLNNKSEAYIRFWVQRLGVVQASNLVDTLFDYIDDDNFNRARGGEQADYVDTDVVVANRPLFEVTEVCDILLWRDLEICSSPLEMARLFYVGNGDFISMRIASEVMKKFALADRYVENNLGSQIIAWQSLAESHGFFEYEMLSGLAGPEYVLISKTGLEEGVFKRIDVKIMPIGSARPIEILSHWETSFTSLDYVE